jgi:hypothetical protein
MLGIEKVEKNYKTKLTFPINGVLFQVTLLQLKKLDQRENEYRRIIVKTLPGEKPTLLNTALSKLTLNFRSF